MVGAAIGGGGGGRGGGGKAPSKQALAMHRKWQEAAEEMGGPDARIVVSKPAAKTLIYNQLHDAFAPMNITQIHKVRGLFAFPPVMLTIEFDVILQNFSPFQPTRGPQGCRSISSLEVLLG